jgi:beta-glucuronidase
LSAWTDTERTLKRHAAAARERSEVGGLIFFCYNDCRTHVGDEGVGALKQSVGGVVDLYGAREPSFDVLRRESSPVELIEVARHAKQMGATHRRRSLAWPGMTAAGLRTTCRIKRGRRS